MGGLLHLFYQGHLGRKHKKQGDVVVEAPRNSLEYAAETWQSQSALGNGEEELPKRSYSATDASMKKLICEEMSKRSNKQNAPSVVARLMGMDMLPVDKKSEVQPHQEKIEKISFTDKKVQHVEKVSPVPALKKSKSYSKKEHRSYKDAYFRYWSSGTNMGKPRPRLHPQEKELQKFKREFEAWQAARFLECARVVELRNIPEQWLAQLDLTKEKMTLYETSRKAIVQKPVEPKSDRLKSRSLRGDFEHFGYKKDIFQPEHKDSYSLSGRSLDREFEYLGYKKDTFQAEHKESYSFSGRSSDRDFEQLSLKDSDLKSDKSSAPTKIVILKPGPDSFSTANDESWVTSTCSMEDRDCIEDLLEEVKQRLKFEMQGKTLQKGSMVRGGGIETPYKEKPAYIKKAYEHVLRENGSRDGRKLRRSESARSYRTEYLANELAPSSPEFMSRDAKNFLSERLRNALVGENQRDFTNFSDGFSREPLFDDARARLEKARDILNAESGRKYWHDKTYEDTRASSFRRELIDDENFQEQPSPRNLVRSLSAPVSMTSFGKLLLEDRCIPSGAHIKRKHEAFENLSSDGKGQRKERFNFREKVSTIKSSLSLRKKLFSRKLQSMDLSENNEFDSARDMMDGPTILTGFSDRNENATEVPPSPASVCSSYHEEFWKPTDNPSPISVSDVTSVGEHSVNNVFREISSNLTELRKQLNQLDYEGSEITTVTEEHSESEVVDVEDEAEAYIKNLLLTSGLYDGSWVKSFSRWDSYVKPMSNWVFEKVEESYKRPTNENEAMADDERSLEHKLLFDLSNEALTVVLGPPRTLCKFRRNLTDVTMLPPAQGRKLLEQVWDMICEYLNPSIDATCYSLDDLVAHDLNTTPWSNLVDEEISALGKELEYQIAADLVAELVMDLQF